MQPDFNVKRIFVVGFYFAMCALGLNPFGS